VRLFAFPLNRRAALSLFLSAVWLPLTEELELKLESPLCPIGAFLFFFVPFWSLGIPRYPFPFLLPGWGFGTPFFFTTGRASERSLWSRCGFIFLSQMFVFFLPSQDRREMDEVDPPSVAAPLFPCHGEKFFLLVMFFGHFCD